jgi:hypothetical protein
MMPFSQLRLPFLESSLADCQHFFFGLDGNLLPNFNEFPLKAFNDGITL